MAASTARRLGRHSHTRSRVGFSRQHHCIASSPSATFRRLRAFIAERMRMSPIDQLLVLLELLDRRSPAPTQHVTESG